MIYSVQAFPRDPALHLGIYAMSILSDTCVVRDLPLYFTGSTCLPKILRDPGVILLCLNSLFYCFFKS
jgi:hypothetical protein